MDFAYSPETEEWRRRTREFVEHEVVPAEERYAEWLAGGGDNYTLPPMLEELKAEARRRGLWNLFLSVNGPAPEHGAGLTNLEYAPLAEISGRTPLAAEAMNCSAPDTGNMEIIAEFGTLEQRREWLEPLLAGEIRSCFAMTEPEVASSDARNIDCRIETDGDHYVLNGHKWWATGALDRRCTVAVVMGVTDPHADAYRRQSMVLVPMNARGIRIERGLTVFGYEERGGHGQLLLENVRVPKANLLGEEGSGFAIAQARLGPGRIHHCMRAIGLAERALELMCARAVARVAFGKALAQQGVVQDWIAESRMAIEQARLLTLKAAWMMDTVGKQAARKEIAAIKVVAARVATDVIDRAIQVHGGGGVSQEFPLAAMFALARSLHFADGPDEVHKMVLARDELRPYGAAAKASTR